MALKSFNRSLKNVTSGIQNYAQSIPTVGPPNFGKIGKQNYDYLIGDEFKFKGSVIVGKMSYSGADIKVILMKHQEYDKKAKKIEEDFGLQVDAYDNEAKILKFEEQELRDAISRAKRDTDTEINLKKAYIANFKAQEANQKNLEAAQENHKQEVDKLQENPPVKVLAEVQTLTISVFRDKAPVRSIGTVYPKGFTRGPRQIGGSLVFTVFDKDVLYEFLEANPSDFDANRFTSAVMDQLPPVDIVMTFANELGSISRMALYGVEFMTSGQVMSIEDMITENVVEYVARDFDPMVHVGMANLKPDRNNGDYFASKSASSLIYEQDYEKYGTSPFERFKRRRNRFL